MISPQLYVYMCICNFFGEPTKITDWLQLAVSLIGFWIIIKTLKTQKQQINIEQEKNRLSVRPFFVEESYSHTNNEINLNLINSGDIGRDLRWMSYESKYVILSDKVTFTHGEILKIKFEMKSESGNPELADIVLFFSDKNDLKYYQVANCHPYRCTVSQPQLIEQTPIQTLIGRTLNSILRHLTTKKS